MSFKNNSIGKKYETTIKLIEKSNIATLRKKTKILIIDDESDEIYEIFKERQYDVYYKSDMSYTIEADPFDIVIMDIKGVGKRRHSSMEGFSLACDVKSKYPLKRICCYSGSLYPEISEHLAEKKIDAFWPKDMDIDKICQKVDKLILGFANYHEQWEILRDEMIKNGVSETDIKNIEGVYFSSFEKGNFIKLNDTIMGTLKNSTTMLNITSSILTLIKVLAV